MTFTVLYDSFPDFLKNDVKIVCEKINFDGDDENRQKFSVLFGGKILQIPYRIYSNKPKGVFFNSTQSLILNCLFTRHHDGFVREKALRKIIQSDEEWITPFVFQLIGEYVIEILDVINENLSPRLIKHLSNFATGNSGFYSLTKSRLVSYWNIYYRHVFPKIDDYVGYKIVIKIEKYLSQKVL